MSEFRNYFVLIPLLLSAVTSHASDLWKSEALFLNGYQSYLDHKYSQCAETLFHSIESGISPEGRARLYLSACQLKLGLRSFAAYHFLQIDESELSNKDKPLYRRLSSTFQREIDESGLHIWLAPFIGALIYGSGSSSSSSSTGGPRPGPGNPPRSFASTSNNPGSAGLFYGLYADFIKQSWTISIGGQVMSFPQTDGTNTTQVTGLLGPEKRFGDSFALWAKGLYVYSSQSNLNSVPIGGAGLRWDLVSSLQFKASYFYSIYPNLSFGPLTISEVTGAFNWKFIREEKQSWAIELGSQSQFAAAPGSRDSTTGFTLRNFYQRSFLELEAQAGTLSLTAGGWLGNEAFGVRNEGFTVYSTLEEHHFGWNAGIKVYTENKWGLQLIFLQEDVIVSRLETMANTIYGSIFFNL